MNMAMINIVVNIPISYKCILYQDAIRHVSEQKNFFNEI